MNPSRSSYCSLPFWSRERDAKAEELAAKREAISKDIYTTLQGIYSLYRNITTLNVTDQEVYDLPKEEIRTHTTSNIEEKLSHIISLIKEQIRNINLDYHVDNISITDLLRDLDTHHLARIRKEALLSIAKCLIKALESKNNEEAEEIITQYPTIAQNLYGMESSIERNDLIIKIISHTFTIDELDQMEESRRQFCLDMPAIVGFYLKALKPEWVKTASTTLLNELQNKDIAGCIFSKKLSLENVEKLYNKFDYDRARLILTNDIQQDLDFEPWMSLSVEEYDQLIKIPCVHLADIMPTTKIIQLFKDSPDCLRALSNKNVSLIVSWYNISLDRLMTLYTRDKDKFKALTSTRASLSLSSMDFDTQEVIYDNNQLNYRYLISPTTAQIIAAIGPNPTLKLLTNNFNTFSAIYTLGETFLTRFKAHVAQLIELHLESTPSLKFHLYVAKLQKLSSESEIKI